MSLTGAQLLAGFSDFIGDYWSSTTTSAGASDGSTLVDTALQRFGRDGLIDGYIRLTSGTYTLQHRRVSNFTTSTATVAPVFGGQVASGVTYQFHRYDPDRKFAALDRARSLAYPQLAVVTMDDTLTGDGFERQLLIPSAIRKGPVQAYEEVRTSPQEGWNLVTNGAMTSLTGWTATTVTAAVYTRFNEDRIIPKYGQQTCIKLSGSAGTLRQTVSSMRITAAQAAGRQVTFGMWVFCRTSGSVKVQIIDDTATVQSAAFHRGLGWEFLQVSTSIVNTNATTLTVGVITNTANTVAYCMDALFRLGPKIGIRYPKVLTTRGLWRDDTNQEIHLNRPVAAGHNVRLIGRTPLTSLGTTPASQITNSMEVDVYSAELLYAKAAHILFVDAGMSAGRIEKEFPKIQEVESRFAQMAPDWEYNLPYSDSIEGWWSDPR